MISTITQSVKSFIDKNPRLVAVLLVAVLALGALLFMAIGNIQATWYSDTGGSNGTWEYRQRIIIDSSQIDSNLQDFPVYVDLADLGTGFFNNVASDGADIRITNARGDELPREVVSVDTASSTGELHFKADNVSSTADTSFYIYYGNTSTSNYAAGDTYGRNAVWSEYEAVHHMGNNPAGTAPQIVDSTGNGYNLTSAGSMTSDDLVSASLGKGIDFDGVDDRFIIPLLILSGDWTVSSWINVSPNYTNMSLIGENDNTKSLRINQWQSANVGITAGSDLDYGYATPYDTDAHLVWRNDSVNVENDSLYNGVKTGNTLSNDISFDIREVGNVESQWPVNSWVDGTISELRFSLSKLSDNWIATEYKNQNSPSTFYAAGSQETQGSSNIPFGDNPAGDFADADWEYRQMLTIDASQVDADLTDFPVYVDLANMSTSFFANTNTTCGDIRVTNAAGDELAREVVACDRSAETGELHFKADSILSATDTSFFIYYGNSDANNYVVTATYGAQNVWSNYDIVSHLQDDPTGAISDSTGNGNTGTTLGNMQSSDLVNADHGKALQFDGVDQGIDYGANSGQMNLNDMTLSVRMKSNDIDGGSVVAKSYYSAQNSRYYFIPRPGGGAGNIGFDVGGNRNLNFDGSPFFDGEWHTAHVVYDRDGNSYLYLDGVLIGTQDISAGENYNLNSSNHLFLGQYPDSGGDAPKSTGSDLKYQGLLQEYRSQYRTLSADWIETEAANLNDPATFYTVGQSQTVDETAAEGNSATEIRGGEFRGGVEFR